MAGRFRSDNTGRPDTIGRFFFFRRPPLAVSSYIATTYQRTGTGEYDTLGYLYRLYRSVKIGRVGPENSWLIGPCATTSYKNLVFFAAKDPLKRDDTTGGAGCPPRLLPGLDSG